MNIHAQTVKEKDRADERETCRQMTGIEKRYAEKEGEREVERGREIYIYIEREREERG